MWLEGQGVVGDWRRRLAEAANGSVDRARLLAGDSDFAARRDLWRSVPSRLDGTGAAAAALAGEYCCRRPSMPSTRCGPVTTRKKRRWPPRPRPWASAALPARKEVEERHNREARRWRTDELRAGLGNLAGAYRDRMAAHVSQSEGDHGPGDVAAARAEGHLRELADAVATVEDVARELVRNPNETLMLEALMVRLSAIGA